MHIDNVSEKIYIRFDPFYYDNFDHWNIISIFEFSPDADATKACENQGSEPNIYISGS